MLVNTPLMIRTNISFLTALRMRNTGRYHIHERRRQEANVETLTDRIVFWICPVKFFSAGLNLTLTRPSNTKLEQLAKTFFLAIYPHQRFRV